MQVVAQCFAASSSVCDDLCSFPFEFYQKFDIRPISKFLFSIVEKVASLLEGLNNTEACMKLIGGILKQGKHSVKCSDMF